jgi:para-nitrobenzyl esterase
MPFRTSFAVVVVAAGWIGVSAAPDTVKVDGGQIAGVVANGVRVFRGIPFAAPPVGDLRWKAPQPIIAWDGVRPADRFGPQCVQTPYPVGSVYAMETAPQSEDCLYLNVWTTGGAGDKRPVMVWIHGGAWTRGASNIATYDGAALARRGVVVVTTNYRLGPLGFLAHPELTAESPQHSSGNYAILDHVAALRWVQRNIASFGGNPANVTIFGESAGSWSVNAAQATPLAKGLFHRAIGESGAQFGRTPRLSDAEQGGLALAKAVGADSLKSLRAVPAEKLVAVQAFRSSINVDGWVLPDDIRTMFAQKKHSDVPVLVGSNADEWTTLGNVSTFPKTMDDFRKRVESQFPGLTKEFDAAYPVKSEVDIAGALLALGRDVTFSLEMRTWARMVTAAGQRAFLYQFTHVPPGPEAATRRAYHASEIQYVFGNLRNPAFTFTDTDRRLSEAMSSYWVNFATTGNPNGKGLSAWSAYDVANEPYLELGAQIQAKHQLLKTQLDFLEQAQEARRSTANPIGVQ